MIYKKQVAAIFPSYTLSWFTIVFFSFTASAQPSRQKISINNNWRFHKSDPNDVKGIFYDVRPEVTNKNDNVVADTRADQSNTIKSDSGLKKWILPSANEFIKDNKQ